MLRFLYTAPLKALESLLIYTDTDYRRMLASNNLQHDSTARYWEYVEGRRELEKQPDTKKIRLDPDFWQRVRNSAEIPEDQPAPDDDHSDPRSDAELHGRTELEQAEHILGLTGMRYNREQATSIYHQLMFDAHPDRGGSLEWSQELNNAMTTLKRHHEWP